MSNNSFCKKHNTHPSDDKWKVMLEEILESESIPFEGEVCPCCYHDLVYLLKKTKRSLKVESKSAVRLRRENSEMREIVEAVMSAVYALTGNDAQELAEKEYDKNKIVHGSWLKEHGDLKNILPNLITEAVSMARKKKEE